MIKLDKSQLIKRIRKQGIEIDSINELMKIGSKDKDLIPLIVEFLQLIDDETDKEFLVRCLGVKGYYEASSHLIKEFYSTEKITYKWAIGNSLAIISDETKLDEMLKIVVDKKHGISRQMIVEGLGAYNTNEVRKILIQLLSDEDVVDHAIYALSKIGDESTKKYIEPFVTHKTTWIRKSAIKALKKIDKI